MTATITDVEAFFFVVMREPTNLRVFLLTKPS